MKALLGVALATALLVVLVSCVVSPAPAAPIAPASAGMPAATAALTVTATITATAAPTTTAVPTATVAPTTTATVTPTAVITATAAPTATATITPTPPITVTATPTVPAPTAAPPTATPVPPSTPTAPPSPTPTAGPPATPTPLPSTVFVRNTRGYREGSDYLVVGEVVNGGPAPVYNVKVIATFYDAASKLVGAQEAVAYLPQTVPTQANPFVVRLANAPGSVASFELTLTWDDLTLANYDRVTIVREEVRQENGLTLTGDLRNDHRSEIRNIVVVATLYDAQGLVLAVLPGSAGANSLAPGATTTFTINSPQPLAYSSYLIQTEGMLLP